MGKFLQDSEGNFSSGRLIFVIGSFWNMVMTTYLVFHDVEPATALAFFSGVEAVLLGLKLGQNIQEKK